MGKADYLLLGTNNVICDQCGKKFKSKDLKEQWNGLWTCRKCWDYRHPQEYLRGVPDNMAPELSRPEAPDTFTAVAQSLELPDDSPSVESIVAAFSGTPLSGEAPLEVQFTDASTGSINSYSWDFGDSETSSEQNPAHTYAAEGTYTVSLLVSNEESNDTETKTDYITVTATVGTLMFSFTSTGTPSDTSALFVGTSLTDYYAISITSTEVSLTLVVSSAIIYADSVVASPEGDFVVQHNGSTVSVLQNDVVILSNAYTEITPLSQQALVESSPNTITNIVIN